MGEYPALVACEEWTGFAKMDVFAAHFVFSTQAEPMKNEIAETVVHENLALVTSVKEFPQFPSLAKCMLIGVIWMGYAIVSVLQCTRQLNSYHILGQYSPFTTTTTEQTEHLNRLNTALAF
jgi:hypothetical protein